MLLPLLRPRLSAAAGRRPVPRPLRAQAQIQSRDQRALLLARFDPRTGARTAVHREESAVWVNLHDAFRPLSSARCASSGASLAGGFLWASERTGFRHLYVHGADGRVVGAVTAGQWQVDSLEGVDEEQGLVYFTGAVAPPGMGVGWVVSLAASLSRACARADLARVARSDVRRDAGQPAGEAPVRCAPRGGAAGAGAARAEAAHERGGVAHGAPAARPRSRAPLHRLLSPSPP